MTTSAGDNEWSWYASKANSFASTCRSFSSPPCSSVSYSSLSSSSISSISWIFSSSSPASHRVFRQHYQLHAALYKQSLPQPPPHQPLSLSRRLLFIESCEKQEFMVVCFAVRMCFTGSLENLEYLLERTLRLVSLLRKRSIEASRNLLTPSGSSDQDGAWLLINMLLLSWTRTSCKEDRRRKRYSFFSENPRSPDTEVVGALTMRSRSRKVKGHISNEIKRLQRHPQITNCL